MRRRRAVPALVALGLAVILVLARDAAADQITVLCSSGLKAVIEDLVPKFERATKHTVVVKYGLAAVLGQRIEGGEAFDVAFVTPAVMDGLVAHRKIAADTRTTIARSGLAIAIRAGAAKTDISTVDAFKRAMLNAKSIGYSTAGSGLMVAKIMQDLGLTERLKAFKANRDPELAERRLEELREVARGTGNLLPPIRQALKDRCSMGEVCGAMKDVFGEYQPTF